MISGVSSASSMSFTSQPMIERKVTRLQKLHIMSKLCAKNG